MKYYHQENLDNTSSVAVAPVAPIVPAMLVMPVAPVMHDTPIMNDMPVISPITLGSAPVASVQQKQIDSIVAGGTQLTTADLLPKYDDASDFAKQNPVSKILSEQSFLQAGSHIGINTQGQSNKIPYLDIRSMPPIPKQEAGPWMQSSYEEPVGAKRRYFELG